MNEIYKGTKFKTIFNSSIPPQYTEIEELQHWCAEFSRLNLTPEYEGGSSGNLSYRTNQGKNEFIITATGLKSKKLLSTINDQRTTINDSLSTINDQVSTNFVKINDCDLNNKIVYAEGVREPSSETMMHYAIYAMRPDINAIFHGHSDYILTNYNKLGIPSTSEEKPYGTIELIDSIKKIAKHSNFFILKNHGFISLGSSQAIAAQQTIKLLNNLS